MRILKVEEYYAYLLKNELMPIHFEDLNVFTTAKVYDQLEPYMATFQLEYYFVMDGEWKKNKKDIDTFLFSAFLVKQMMS
jgi:hypothetical protein